MDIENLEEIIVFPHRLQFNLKNENKPIILSREINLILKKIQRRLCEEYLNWNKDIPYVKITGQNNFGNIVFVEKEDQRKLNFISLDIDLINDENDFFFVFEHELSHLKYNDKKTQGNWLIVQLSKIINLSMIFINFCLFKANEVEKNIYNIKHADKIISNHMEELNCDSLALKKIKNIPSIKTVFGKNSFSHPHYLIRKLNLLTGIKLPMVILIEDESYLKKD